MATHGHGHGHKRSVSFGAKRTNAEAKTLESITFAQVRGFFQMAIIAPETLQFSLENLARTMYATMTNSGRQIGSSMDTPGVPKISNTVFMSGALAIGKDTKYNNTSHESRPPQHPEAYAGIVTPCHLLRHPHGLQPNPLQSEDLHLISGPHTTHGPNQSTGSLVSTTCQPPASCPHRWNGAFAHPQPRRGVLVSPVCEHSCNGVNVLSLHLNSGPQTTSPVRGPQTISKNPVHHHESPRNHRLELRGGGPPKTSFQQQVEALRASLRGDGGRNRKEPANQSPTPTEEWFFAKTREIRDLIPLVNDRESCFSMSLRQSSRKLRDGATIRNGGITPTEINLAIYYQGILDFDPEVQDLEDIIDTEELDDLKEDLEKRYHQLMSKAEGGSPSAATNETRFAQSLSRECGH